MKKFSKKEDGIILKGVKSNKSYEDIAFEINKLGNERNAESIRNRYKRLRKNDPTLEPKVYNSQNNVKSFVEEDEPKYIVNAKNVVSWKYRHGMIELKLEHLDDIFYRYSRHGLNMSQVKIQNHYGLTAIQWQSLKRTFDLVKDSDVFSTHSLSLVSGKEKTDMIASKIAEKYSDKNMREVVEYESDKQQSRAYSKALKKAETLEYRRQEFESEILDYVTQATGKTVVKKVKNKSKRHGVHTIADLHVGADIEAEFNLPAYNTEIIRDRLRQTAELINAENNAKNTICINGDFIESFTGLNHINSWKGIDKKYGYGVKATILACDLLREFFAQVENIHEVLLVAGNHDRTTSNSAEDVDGEVVQWIHYVLQAEFGHLFNIDHSPDVLVRAIENVCYIWTHGHLSISKRQPAEIINQFGIQGMFCLVIEGHLHTRKVKFDSAMARVLVMSSFFTGNNYSKKLGYSTLAGFLTCYSNGKYPITIDIPLT